MTYFIKNFADVCDKCFQNDEKSEARSGKTIFGREACAFDLTRQIGLEAQPCLLIK
jgi:hypothetical protein